MCKQQRKGIKSWLESNKESNFVVDLSDMIRLFAVATCLGAIGRDVPWLTKYHLKYDIEERFSN